VHVHLAAKGFEIEGFLRRHAVSITEVRSGSGLFEGGLQ
jgi:hypothetical protein